MTRYPSGCFLSITQEGSEMNFMSGAAWKDTPALSRPGGRQTRVLAKSHLFAGKPDGAGWDWRVPKFSRSPDMGTGIKPGLRSPDDLSWIDRLGMKTCITLGGGLALMVAWVCGYIAH